MDNVQRKIVDDQKSTQRVLKLLVGKCHDGYGDRYRNSFKNAQGNIIDVVEVLSGNTKCLIKISTQLEATIADYDENEHANFEDDDVNAIDGLKIEEED